MKIDKKSLRAIYKFLFVFGWILVSSHSFSKDKFSYADSLKQVIGNSEFEESHLNRKLYFGNLLQSGKVEEAEQFVYSTIDEAKARNDEFSVVMYKVYLSIAQRFQANYDSAYNILFDCLEKSVGVDENDSLKIQIYNVFGILLFDKGQNLDALMYFNKAAKLAEEQDSKSEFLVHLLNNMAAVCTNISKYDLGIEYCKKAQAINQGEDRGIAMKLNFNLGIFYREKGEYDLAKEKFEIVLHGYKEKEYSEVYLMTLTEMLNTIVECCEDDDIDSLVNKINGLQDLKYSYSSKAFSFNAIGKAFMMKKRYSEAIQSFKNAYKVAEENGIYVRALQSAKRLYDAYSVMEEKDSAIHFLLIHQNIKDSLDANSDQRQLLAMENKLSLWEAERLQTLAQREIGAERYQKRAYQGIAFAFVIISGLLYLLFVRKKQQNKILYERTRLLADKPKIVVEKPITVQKKQIEDLSLPNELINALDEKLNLTIQGKKLYLNQDCNAAMVGAELGTNRTYLNAYTKLRFNQTFSEYINDLRLNHLIDVINNDGSARNFTIDYLSSMVGFKSKRTLERAFKNKTGITPAFYIQQLKADIERG